MKTSEPIGTATYSPEDNKLRIYPFARLSPELYSRVKSAGFSWAPKQELFVAPMWTPDRADLCEELCGDIGDEDKSMAERAEERAERFADYSDKRTADAGAARDAVKAIAGNIPLGQPILVGHHSEARARKDAERIESGMRRAVKMWETADYWKQRAEGAVRHARYKELPAVRARRIKGNEADRRKSEKIMVGYQRALRFWSGEMKFKDTAGTVAPLAITEENRGKIIAFLGMDADLGWLHLPRKEGDKPDWSQQCTAHTGLAGDYPSLYALRTVEEVREHALQVYPRSIAARQRWLDHYDNRLTYERTMLAEDGGLVTDQIKPEVGGAYAGLWAPRGGWAYIRKVNRVTITVNFTYNEGGRVFGQNIPFDKVGRLMSKAQVDAARAEGRLLEVPQIGFLLAGGSEPQTVAENPDKQEAAAMREALKEGVKAVVAPQLFPTPEALAREMVKRAGTMAGSRILEPSAGTGIIIKAIIDAATGADCCRIVAVEVNHALCQELERRRNLTVYANESNYAVHCRDFLACNGDLGTFDRIVMNPPFKDGADIKHILHARHMLKPGGRLVALCANGPRQQRELMPLCDSWEELTAGSFSEQGTEVNVAMLTMSPE